MSEVALQSKCRSLRTELRTMKYASIWNEKSLLSGDPGMYLRLFHFFFIEYSPQIKTWIVENGYNLQTATDLSFVQQIFRLLQTQMGYRSKLTVENFFKPKFALQKLNLSYDVAKLIQTKAKSLNVTH
ncbi:centrosomal protein of 44 kDa-like protein [Tritrichomonas foetus]|uniref:Centrosomal protein of 44 kDa n=1 Tax=Tritrichomonas foetus TaxID=1144522 RepID=A0A1J4K290_9EUKA|nr:centrosomal protein of 44 kDa-like protein [Tritrichomonas foetus]|eukprot:OHT05511.1 centrosomal protein of 44 kDa-like protein [Tritrichomonas foetus]